MVSKVIESLRRACRSQDIRCGTWEGLGSSERSPRCRSSLRLRCRYRPPLLIAALLAVAVWVLPAQEVYVTARVGTVLAQPNPSAQRVAVVRQGDALAQLGEADGWFQVEARTGTGYINQRFVSADAPVQTDRGSTGLQNISSVTTRRRSSAYSTSAAATRGLSDDNPRQRQNMGFDQYDFRSLSWIDAFGYPDDELIAFAEAEGLGF